VSTAVTVAIVHRCSCANVLLKHIITRHLFENSGCFESSYLQVFAAATCQYLSYNSPFRLKCTWRERPATRQLPSKPAFKHIGFAMRRNCCDQKRVHVARIWDTFGLCSIDEIQHTRC